MAANMDDVAVFDELVALGSPEGDAFGLLGTPAKRQHGGGVMVLAAVVVLFTRKGGLGLRKEGKKTKSDSSHAVMPDK